VLLWQLSSTMHRLLVLAMVAALEFACTAATTDTPPSAPPARIALLHMYDGAAFFQRLGSLTGANKARYAARNGYDLITRTPYGVSGLWRRADDATCRTPPCWQPDPDFDIDASRAPTFGKLSFTLAACNNRPNAWLLWSDADAIVVNQSTRLEAIIDDGYDVMVAHDWLMLQAGVILFKCSPWTIDFIAKVYNDRAFDTARALDQSALESHINALSAVQRDAHIKHISKFAFNVYPEEYRPGDFIVHMAGKLYEATEPGLWAIANQLDIFSAVDDVCDIEAFFDTRYLLNYYSGVCKVKLGEKQSSCSPEDDRRIRLEQPLASMAAKYRYRHVALRYYFLQNWTDKYDVPDWNLDRRKIIPFPLARHQPVRALSVFLETPTRRNPSAWRATMGSNRLPLDKAPLGDQTLGTIKHRLTAPHLNIETRVQLNYGAIAPAIGRSNWWPVIVRWMSILIVVSALFLVGFLFLQRHRRRQNVKRQ
jgi:hypothetical protein